MPDPWEIKPEVTEDEKWTHQYNNPSSTPQREDNTYHRGGGIHKKLDKWDQEDKAKKKKGR